MKRIILIFLNLFILSSAGKLLAQHDHHNTQDSNHEMTEEMNTNNFEVPVEFQAQLYQVMRGSEELNEALVNGQFDRALGAATNGLLALEQVDMMLLEGKAHHYWMTQRDILKTSLTQIQNADELKDQRAVLNEYSEALYNSVKAFGIGEHTAFYQFCPMANSNQGGHWMSTTQEIINPYFGSMMLHCGKTIDTVE